MGSTLKFTFKNPVFLIPFLFSLILIVVINGAIILYLPTETTSIGGYVGIGILVLFVTSFFLAIAQLILLELLEQHEKQEELNLFKAISEALTQDSFRALPIIVIWSLVQYLMNILESMSRGRNNRSTFLSRAVRGLQRGLSWGYKTV